MNSSVQKPTKIISMDIGRLECNKVAKCTGKKDMVPLDFYTINNAVEEDTKSAQRGVESATAVSELLSLAKAKTLRRSNKSRGLMSKDSLDFIILSIKNDMRVKHFKPAESSVKICFWIVDDAVAFYKQYFSLVEMSFVEEFDFDFRWIDLRSECSNSMRTSQQTISGAHLSGDTWSECKPQIGDDFFEVKPFLSKPSLGAPHSTELYKSQKSEFDRRVEYFNRMKPLFSKSDFKKMEAALEGGCLDFVFKNCKELAVGSISNVIVQKSTKHMNDDQICTLVKSFGYDIAPISATKYGAYTIQTLILAAVTKTSQNLISCYFEGSGRFLISHEIGNYSIQKILRFDQEMIYDFFMKDLDRIIDHQLGFKVFRRCVPFFVGKKDLILEKLANIETPENSEKCRVIVDALNQ